MNTDHLAPRWTQPLTHIRELLQHAAKYQASDMHCEPGEHAYRVRFRQHGQLHTVFSGAPKLAARFTSQLKVMAHLDIAEQRLPQDGRMRLKMPTLATLDIRVSTCPTVYGEKIVLRLLRPHACIPDFASLGLVPAQQAVLTQALAQPQGLILVTGPTGSGKTTTLYSALNTLNKTTHNIASVEDPVEIVLPGINQVAVHAKIDLTFARVLRSLLRQDPDIIMVGEIRDPETAHMAIQAAQTGHLVLSTVHASSSIETINRLLHMGINRYELVSSLSLIIAQRLLRQKSTPARVGVYECLPMTQAAAQYFLDQAYYRLDVLKQHVDFISLQQAAKLKQQQGVITSDEIKRVIGDG